METKRFSDNDLAQLRRQLTGWRGSRTAGSRIPDQVWEAATVLARRHGVAHVARVLRLDFYKLRKRAGQGSSRAAVSVKAPKFVEVPWPKGAWANGSTNRCTVELSDGGAGRMRMELPADAASLASLVQAFWRRQS